MISKVRLFFSNFDSITSKNKTTNEPISEPITTDKAALKPPKTLENKNVTKAAPRLEADEIPSTDGPAKGFAKTVCMISPLTAKAEPAQNAVKA